MQFWNCRLAAGISSFFAKREKPSPNRSPESSRKAVPLEEEMVKRSPEPTRRTAAMSSRSPTPEKRRQVDRDEPQNSLTPVDNEENKEKREGECL